MTAADFVISSADQFGRLLVCRALFQLCCIATAVNVRAAHSEKG